MSLAWHMARLGLTDPKKFPRLETLLINRTAPRRAARWEEQFAVMGAWIASTEG